MAYPTADDVTEFLASLTVDAGSYDLAGDLSAAIREFESATGRPSFQGSSEDESVRYDPPDRLGGDNRIRIHDFYDITSIVYGYTLTEAGTELVEETDYWPIRDEQAGPVVGLDFVINAGRTRKSIRVTGKRGYSEECPADVSKAIIRRVAAMYMRSPSGQAGIERRRKNGEREIEYDTSAGRDVISRFEQEFADVCTRYLRCI